MGPFESMWSRNIARLIDFAFVNLNLDMRGFIDWFRQRFRIGTSGQSEHRRIEFQPKDQSEFGEIHRRITETSTLGNLDSSSEVFLNLKLKIKLELMEIV